MFLSCSVDADQGWDGVLEVPQQRSSKGRSRPVFLCPAAAITEEDRDWVGLSRPTAGITREIAAGSFSSPLVANGSRPGLIFGGIGSRRNVVEEEALISC
jgi:hypothetical protein